MAGGYEGKGGAPAGRGLCRLFGGALFGLLAAAGPAAAQQAANRETAITVGVGVGVIPSYAGSNDARVIPGGFVRGKVAGFPIVTRGGTLYVDAIRDSGRADGIDIGAGPLAGVRLERVETVGDERVEALGELNPAVELGGWVGVAKTGVVTSAYDRVAVRLAWRRDVANAYGGTMLTPAVEYATPLSTTTYVGLSLAADYVGKGFGRYYYDVSPAGAVASGLSVYDAAGRKAGFVRWNLGVMAGKSLSGDLRQGWSLLGGVGYGRMLGRYARSPVVSEAGSRDQWMGGMGLAYTF